MSTRKTTAAVAAVTALAVVSVAAARPAAGTATRVTDATGDSGAAPDVRYVDVGNDVVTGAIVIWVETPNRKQLEGDDGITVYLDTDLNPATGGTLGMDVVLAGDSSGTVRLLRWSGSGLVQVPAPTLSWQQRESWVRIAVHPSDFGGTHAFNWVVAAGNSGAFDFVPDTGPGSYSLVAGPLVLALDAFEVAPKAPVAGKRFTAGMTIVREDTAEPLGTGVVSCTVTIGGKRVAAQKGWGEEVAGCTLVVPRTAKGKQLRLTMTVSYGGQKVSRTYTGKVR